MQAYERPRTWPKCDLEGLTSAPRQRPGADSPPWKGEGADLQLFENENQIVPEASFPAHPPVESAQQSPCQACDVPESWTK